MEDAKKKEAYETPSLIVHGSIESITEAALGVTAIDASFPANTPLDDLTFS